MSETPEARRARLRAAAIKGGEATKAKRLADPDYYKRVGSMGGHATRGVTHKKKRRRKEPGKAKPRHVGAARHHTPKPPTLPKSAATRTAPTVATAHAAFEDLDAFMRRLAE